MYIQLENNSLFSAILRNLTEGLNNSYQSVSNVLRPHYREPYGFLDALGERGAVPNYTPVSDNGFRAFGETLTRRFGYVVARSQNIARQITLWATREPYGFLDALGEMEQVPNYQRSSAYGIRKVGYKVQANLGSLGLEAAIGARQLDKWAQKEPYGFMDVLAESGAAPRIAHKPHRLSPRLLIALRKARRSNDNLQRASNENRIKASA